MTTGITVDSAYKFAGGYYDNATKLYHFGDRYYDPNLGQWTQRDTSTGSLASPAGINKFTYANSDPVNGVDPSGHDISISPIPGLPQIQPNGDPTDGFGFLQPGALSPANTAPSFKSGANTVGSFAGCEAGGELGGEAFSPTGPIGAALGFAAGCAAGALLPYAPGSPL